MFTGIVETTGTVLDRTSTADGQRLRVGTDLRDLSPGQSIAVDGACLTVEERGGGAAAPATDDASDAVDRSSTATDDDLAGHEGWFEAFLATETLERTTLGDRGVGDSVNLERAMPADGRFDGHIVQGHVDATATVESVERVGGEDGDWRYAFSLPASVADYVVEKGSITVDGISLTVAERDADAFAVAIVPTTRSVTALSEREPGDAVNLEVDVVAKYVEQLC